MEVERGRAEAYADRGDVAALLDLPSIEREMIKRGGLREFQRLGWKTMRPGVKLVGGWHLDAVNDFVQAWIRGLFQNGVINIPPRMTKSYTASVSAPVWAWTEAPYLQFLTASYRDELSTRDAVRSRRLINSKWFQERWGDKFSLFYDQNRKTFYENDKGGYRLAQSVAGGSTGEGGNRIIVDDPHNVGRAESDKERTSAVTWWDEEMTSRLNDQTVDGKLIIMQRLHERDLTGHVLDKDLDYEHLCLPMEFEPKRKCVVHMDGFHFEDPRTEPGELLEPVRFPERAIRKMEIEMGPYSAAGQLQQNPKPREGGMFDETAFRIVPAPPAGIKTMIRYWDKAGTDSKVAKGTGAHTAGVLMGRITSGEYAGCFIVLDVVRGQWAASKREQVIENTAILDTKKVKVWVEQEPGSGGKESAEATIKRLSGFTVEADRVTGEKVTRAEPYSSQQVVGNILLLQAPWNARFMHEHGMFPVGAQKDQVDAAAGAFNKLAATKDRRLSW